jgi:hypothetical protein
MNLRFIKGLLCALLVTNAILFADDVEDELENNAYDTEEGTSKLSEEVYQPRRLSIFLCKWLQSCVQTQSIAVSN